MPNFLKRSDLTRIFDADEVNAMPLLQYDGPIHLIQTEKALSKAMIALQKEKVLGFDTETRPAFRKGKSYLPSLVQLACGRSVYLIQLNKITDITQLIPLFENPEVLKVGVAIGDDVKRLEAINPFEGAGFMDVSKMAHVLGIKRSGLRNLTALLFEKRISKRAQLSNWAREHLTEAQIRYAATDAWVSRKLYLKLKEFI